ncbi:MAG: hypothetical protein EPO27_10710 [Betaproteobacteria bacterium]|nr:MAG: hypothetical protein EPO27_10710 [Betaproteobacteria bacterium]
MAKWTKGQSGNPGGRPKEMGYLREIARKHREAIETLVTVMQNSEATDQARVHAATALLDRGWGRPAQTITNSNGNTLKVDEKAFESTRELLAKYIDKPENTREAASAIVTAADEGDAPASGVTHQRFVGFYNSAAVSARARQT